MGIKKISLLFALLLFTSSCSNGVTNYSGDGACSSLESLINQLGMMEIRDTQTFYNQLDSIESQALSASAQDPSFLTMADQISSFGEVWFSRFPDAVPNYLGTVPLQYTSDEFCGTNFGEEQ